MGDKVMWGIIFPTIVFVGMMLIPYIDLAPSRRFKDRRFMLCLCFFLISGTTVLSYMGLAEYGVTTSADATILFELTHEPAHNKMGIVLPVPYDELVPGMYTTRQFAVEDEADARAAITALNDEIEGISFLVTVEGVTETVSLEKFLVDYMESVNNPIEDLRFTPVPQDAPELEGVMDEFEVLVAEPDQELLNGWGFIIVTQAQDDLRRLDVVIVWQSVELEGGRPVLDNDGNPIPILDDEGNIVWRANSTHVYIHRESAYFLR
jgi:hypothetical protein